MPIIEYLDETRKNGPNLVPKNAIKRVKARSIAEIINSGIQPYQSANVVQRIAKELGNEKRDEWLSFYLNKGLKAVEETLKETSGKYCVGDEISIADLCLVPQVGAAKRYNINLTAYPLISRINSDLEILPEFM